MTKTMRDRCRKRLEMRTDAVAPPIQIGDVKTAKQEGFNRRCAVAAQDIDSYWMQIFQTINNSADDTQNSLQQFVLPSTNQVQFTPMMR